MSPGHHRAALTSDRLPQRLKKLQLALGFTATTTYWYITDGTEGKYLNFTLGPSVFLVFKLTGLDNGRPTANNKSVIS